MRQAAKGHAGCACTGKHDFVARKTPKSSHFSQKNERSFGVFRALGASGACPAPTAAEQRRGSAIASRDRGIMRLNFNLTSTSSVLPSGYFSKDVGGIKGGEICGRKVWGYPQ